MGLISRRRFVYAMAGVGTSAGALAALRLGFDRTEAPTLTRVLHRHHRTSWALGSAVSITALHRDSAAAVEAVDDAFQELALIEEIMSIYRADSQLSRLNRAGVLDDPHPYFVDVLQAAQSMSVRSQGAFDITVQPLWSLYSNAQRLNRLPSAESIESARRQVNWKRVHVTRNQICLDGEGTAITLNGIAQGYAADRVATVLREHDIHDALFDTGELGALGKNAKGLPWRVGIQHPRHHEAYISVAALAGRCLATSGDYATTFSNDYRHHHLVDPRTGCSPSDLSSVSVAAKSGLDADALSTAAFVMGAENGLQLVSDTPGADALLVLKDGRAIATAGFPALRG